MGIEPTTCSLGSYRSATELRPREGDASCRLGARLGRSARSMEVITVFALSRAARMGEGARQGG